MRIVLLCATDRGYRVLEKLAALANSAQPKIEFVVFSFREEAHEPPFLDRIKGLSESIGAVFHEAKQIGSEKWRDYWEQTPFDLMLAVSWRYMVPRTVYEKARSGAYVFHDSLLPTYRGFSPTVWAMINGENSTGVTLFQMADEVDNGDIIAQTRVPIGETDTIADVMEAVTEAYLTVLEANFTALIEKTAVGVPQNHVRATYTCRRLPEDNAIQWDSSTRSIYNLIRAVTAPYNGAWTTLNGERLVIWSAKRMLGFPSYIGRMPGRIVEVRRGVGAVVLTGDGALLITEVGRPGEARQPADQVLTNLSMTLGR
ncbi:MAG: formyltransferase family protein [Anaerolineae bacterium]